MYINLVNLKQIKYYNIVKGVDMAHTSEKQMIPFYHMQSTRQHLCDPIFTRII